MSPAASPGPTPAEILALALDRPPTLGSGRLICLDGPAGSGKTTWAAGIAQLAPDAHVVHMDDLYAGLVRPAGGRRPARRAAADLSPRTGRAPTAATTGWPVSSPSGSWWIPAPLLVVEGVGCGASRFADLVTVLVWVEAPEHLRMERGIARDGDAFAPHWKQWAVDEAEVFAREQTRERADVRIDGAQPYPASDPSR